MNLTIGSEAALAFVLCFTRCAEVMVALPKMIGITIPITIRALLAGVIAAALMPAAQVAGVHIAGTPALALMVMREAGVGLVLSFAAAIVVGAVTMAGDLIGHGMEMNSGGILRGTVAVPNTIADGLSAVTGLMFFVAGFHRALIVALARSLAVAPLGGVEIPGGESMLSISGRIFEIALQIGLPLMVPLFVLSLAQGVISRLAPQINVLVAAPAAILLAGLTLLVLDAGGLADAILRAWSSVMGASLGWIDG